jgi:syntaxin 5
LNSQCDAAQQFVEDSKRQTAAKNQASSHNLNVVTSLKSELMQTTKTFKTALEMRSYKMKHQQEKKIQMAGNSTLSPMRQFKATQKNQSGAGGGQDGTKMNANMSNSAMKSMIAASPYSNSASPPLSPYNQDHSHPEQKQHAQMMLLAPPSEVHYYDQRQQAVTEVEKTIGELGTLFKRLSAMISEQAELVDRIDDDIENAIEQSDLAQGALLKTYEQVSSNRGMYTKLATIGVLSGLFFVLFLM